MRFDRDLVEPQVRAMLERFQKDELIEVEVQAWPKLQSGIQRILVEYIEAYDEIENDSLGILASLTDEDRFRRRVLKNLAADRELPIFSDAYDYINAKIQEWLWDSDDVEEIFGDPRQFVAAITPHLKAMKKRGHS